MRLTRVIYLEMIKEIPFQYDLDNPVLELIFQSELSKIVKHYDSLTIAEEAEAVKILLRRMNIPNVYMHPKGKHQRGCPAGHWMSRRRFRS